MLILFVLIILTFGTIFLQITSIGASYKIYIDLISALATPLLAIFVTLISESISSFLNAVKHSIVAAAISEEQFAGAQRIFKILERNLIIATILVTLLDAVGILAGNANEKNANWLRTIAAALLDPAYGSLYILLLQGFKNRLKALK